MSGIKIATAHSHSFQSGAFSFMPCTSGRESLPLDDNDSPQPIESKTESKKKKFHPLRNLRRMFRRKGRRSSISADSYQTGVADNPEIGSASLEQRSCSTSRLQEENSTQNYITNNNNRLNPGLSLSHDSIFTPERADSGLSSSDLGNSSLSITVITPPSRECATVKSHQSSCSETSLLSIGSSEVDELSPVKNKKLSDLDVGVTSYKLSHSAAKHKMAVKPRRNHGAPRTRRKPTTSISPLPTTIEVNEEKISGVNSQMEIWDLDSSGKSHEEHQGGRDEEGLGQRSESFFGRFLSRRSEKKKKTFQAPNAEEINVEDKSGSLKKRPVKSSKSPNRRQRVEPMEIPTGAGESDDSKEGKTVSNSVSPPRNVYWPNEMTSRSISPPKSVWPDLFVPGEESCIEAREEKTKSIDASSSKDVKNANFIRELTNSISLFAKDEMSKRKKNEEKDGDNDNDDNETMINVRREETGSEDHGKTVISVENEADERDAGAKPEPATRAHREVLTIQVNSSGSSKEEFSSIQEPPAWRPVDITDPNAEPRHEKIIFKDVKPEDFVDDKKETETQLVTIVPTTPEKENLKITEEKKEEPETLKKTEPEEKVKREKPLISQKPKNLKRIGNGGFVKAAAKTKGTETEVKSEPETEEASPTNKSTVNFNINVNKRKSDLISVAEATEKKDSYSSSKGPEEKEEEEANFKEVSSPGTKEEETSPETSPVISPETTEEVVLRRKSQSSHAEDQPELMKVFARRSLKIRETEKLGEDFQRSRDSDKENETVESPRKETERKKEEDDDEGKEKEEDEEEGGKAGGEKKRKKSKEGGNRNSMTSASTTRMKSNPMTTGGTTTIAAAGNEVKVNLTPLKPEVTTANKNLLQRYGRSLSESNGRKDETSILDQNKMNVLARKITGIKGEIEEETEPKAPSIGGGGVGGGGLGTGAGAPSVGGFKRIQQRKAEWEMRAQQSAK